MKSGAGVPSWSSGSFISVANSSVSRAYAQLPGGQERVVRLGFFAGLAGWIADHFPGTPVLDSNELTAIFVAGALAATAEASGAWKDKYCVKTMYVTIWPS